MTNSVYSLPKQSTSDNYNFYTCPSSRIFLSFILDHLHSNGFRYLFIPSYLGLSRFEGSGIYDPSSSSSLEIVYYNIDSHGVISLSELLEELPEKLDTTCFLFAHYFGRIDPSYEQLSRLLISRGAFIIDDLAHGLYTYLFSASALRGNAAFISLHKFFSNPLMPSVGLLRTDSTRFCDLFNISDLSIPFSQISSIFSLLPSDILERGFSRISNFNYYISLIQSNTFQPFISPLYSLPLGIQSFPIILSSEVLRTPLYNYLNSHNVGAVSLYHTLVPAVSQVAFPETHQLSASILNLPLHEHVTNHDIDYIFTLLYDFFLSET